ncbi:hypothetical protein MSAN_02381200 [Mycena sanguinolenta]|uniref:Uncharacterized protein n=1 Tax=Mycena sanguinolenta TaxID=230812 RepID=A0A8H6X4Q1_9AGAR|nr:hypothetical protein MSAN_02381200 [Mycena sanguinolenta]
MLAQLMANTTELPNPSTPLAFLRPALANEFETERYVYAATLGAYVWDIGRNLGNDYELLFKHRVRFPTIVYFLSRAFTLGYILPSFIFIVAPVENCNALAVGLDICLVLSKTITALLFLIRVTAVWHPSKIAYAVFSILFLAVPSANITSPLGVRAAHIGPTKQCIITAVGHIEVAAIMPLVNDTAIFLAINYRILAHMTALLQSGQRFYLISLVTHLAGVAILELSHLTPFYRAILGIPGIALTNVMACLVFRRIKLGLISADGTLNLPTINFPSDFHATGNPRSFSLHPHRTEPTTAESKSNTTSPLDLSVQREIDRFEDGAEASHEVSKPTDLASFLV